MTKLKLDISISLDGYLAGPDPNPDQPLGAAGEKLHDWAYDLRSFRGRHGREGGEEGQDSDILEESASGLGASIMGRGMFGGGPGPWDESWRGWWGEEPPFDWPVFVLTHHPRERLDFPNGASFTFVTDGIESALRQARAAAGEQDVSISGGPRWPSTTWPRDSWTSCRCTWPRCSSAEGRHCSTAPKPTSSRYGWSTPPP